MINSMMTISVCRNNEWLLFEVWALISKDKKVAYLNIERFT